MDFQRTLIIGVIAVLSFMLLTEWVDFKETRNQAPQSAQTETAIDNHTASAFAGALVDSEHEQDLPVIVDAEQKPATAIENTSAMIEVKTDVLAVSLDTLGGDISSASLLTYATKLNTPDDPFQLLERSAQRQYYAQSGLIGKHGIDSNTQRPRFVSSASNYQLDDNEDNLVVDLLHSTDTGVEITKRFTFYRGEYLVDVEYLIQNSSDQVWRGNLFAQIKRDNSADPAAASSGMGMVPFLGAAITSPEKRFEKISFDDMQESPLKTTVIGGWVAMIQHYFLSAWIPDSETQHNYSTAITKSGLNIIRFTSPETIVEPGSTETIKLQFYAGPKDQYRLEEISPGLDLSVDYGWLWWIAQPLFWLLTKIQSLVTNWGLSIILLTVLVKAGFYKLSAASYRSMANMRRVQPKMVEIKELYGDDRQKQSAAMMELYKKEKINPLGGCLPILIQMPVFISLYWVLMESVELRHAPFMLWINDLSVMDPYFVLPLIMGVSMWFQQKLNPPPPDPMQAKVMQWMPVIFTFFFLFFPAGLVLYWVVNNLLSILQQWIITRQIEKAAAS